MIYMGANDGMLHAINAITGNEMFAYVPSPVIADLPQLTDLTYVPPLLRRRLADGRRRLLRRRLAHLARRRHARRRQGAVYALDVTDPTSFSEANAANDRALGVPGPDMGTCSASRCW